jgi:hypothetical protein
MLFKSEEKNMLIGAFVTVAVDAGLEGYYTYRDGAGYKINQHTEDPLYYLYYSINEWLPPVDDLIALVGVPVLLWGLGKYRKSQKMRQMGLGAMVYGFSEIIGWTALKVARAASGKSVASQYSVVNGGNLR